ncbi:hypothetical protein BJ878DRAFT_575335 [Calycina marina]|uniref:Uncharacterized protein n=1 Tax=Calycina marina TaxID=1763456 RepID=A0A9P7Z4Q7_9HELO|nr:hypothetical protein BJ878DRAFT_575335 [Calycina marina]
MKSMTEGRTEPRNLQNFASFAIHYLKHLSNGRERRPCYDFVIASVYTDCSAAFAESRNEIAALSKEKSTNRTKELCQQLVDQHAEVSALWQVNSENLIVQYLAVYKALITAKFDEYSTKEDKKLDKVNEGPAKVLADAEKNQNPWRFGSKKSGEVVIEPLGEASVREMLDEESANTTDSKVPMTTLIAKKDLEGSAYIDKQVLQLLPLRDTRLLHPFRGTVESGAREMQLKLLGGREVVGRVDYLDVTGFGVGVSDFELAACSGVVGSFEFLDEFSFFGAEPKRPVVLGTVLDDAPNGLALVELGAPKVLDVPDEAALSRPGPEVDAGAPKGLKVAGFAPKALFPVETLSNELVVETR